MLYYKALNLATLHNFSDTACCATKSLLLNSSFTFLVWLITTALILIHIRASFGQDTNIPFSISDPIVLHDNIADQWGGHTFSYLVLGNDSIFWSARKYDPEGRFCTALIGQQPIDGSVKSTKLSEITFSDKQVRWINQPQMLRTPDGYIHVFIGVTYSTDNPNYSVGRIHYFRSKDPEDISTLIDRTELIPSEPYKDFHLRMNVGVSPEGDKMALVILAISEDGSVPFNTPVVFVGTRKDNDFIFQKPLQYAEPMSLFYPQVYASEKGIVIVGEVWDKQESHFTRLIHIDWNGKMLHRQDLPYNGDGNYFSFDMKPIKLDDWGKLAIYYNKSLSDHKTCHHEFWEYDLSTKQARLLNSIQTEYWLSNAGKFIPISDELCIFVNNPSMRYLNIWWGDILNGGEIKWIELEQTDPLKLGYQASAYIFMPNVLQGSIYLTDTIYVASDYFNKERKPDKPGPCSFLLWKITPMK